MTWVKDAHLSLNLDHLISNEAADGPDLRGCVGVNADNERRVWRSRDPLGHVKPMVRSGWEGFREKGRAGPT